MLAHEQILQHIKTKHKSPNIPKGKSCMKRRAALGPWTRLLHMSGWRFMVWEYFQFLACPKGANFSMVLPCILTSSCHKAKALQGREPLRHSYRWLRGFLWIWVPRGTPEKEIITVDRGVSHGRRDRLLLLIN